MQQPTSLFIALEMTSAASSERACISIFNFSSIDSRVIVHLIFEAFNEAMPMIHVAVKLTVFVLSLRLALFSCFSLVFHVFVIDRLMHYVYNTCLCVHTYEVAVSSHYRLHSFN